MPQYLIYKEKDLLRVYDSSHLIFKTGKPLQSTKLKALI